MIRHGVTMIEVLMVVMIVAIMSSFALPAVDGFHSNEQVTAAASMLVADVRYARAYAIENQCYVRFRIPDEFAWQVEEPWDLIANDPLLNDPPAGHSDWVSVIDEDERLVPYNVSFEIDPTPPLQFFFSPDGMIRSHSNFFSPPIQTITARFRYREAMAAVFINASGVLESQAWYNYAE